MTRSLAAWCVVLASLVAADAQAQPAARDRIEISGGVRWIGPVDFGSTNADEVTLGAGRRSLFDSDTRLDGSAGVTVLASVRLVRALKLEAAMAYNPTGLTTKITGDTEGAADTTITAPVSQFLVDGGLLAELGRRGHVTPFVTGGGGYVRQLNDGRTLVETGRSYYAGGGFYIVHRSTRQRRVKATGARVDVRAVFLRDGVAPDSAFRGTPSVTAAYFIRF